MRVSLLLVALGDGQNQQQRQAAPAFLVRHNDLSHGRPVRPCMRGSRSTRCCDKAVFPLCLLRRADKELSLAQWPQTSANASCTAPSWVPP